MRWSIIPCLLISLLITGASALATDTGKVLKVLPQYLDLQGRTSLSPSLYDRDAYQAQLRARPEKRSGVVFNIRWQADKELKLRVEARGVVHDKAQGAIAYVLNQTVPKHGGFGNWSKVTITGDDFKKLETLTAWRVTLWDGDKQVSEYKSFLW